MINKFGAWVSVLPVLLIPAAASAQLDSSYLDDVGSNIGGETDLPTLIANLINAFLGVLGIIFLVMVVYAGYLWMMAAGDDEKVKKSKKLLANSVIGLVIIVTAYAISNFVIDQIITATAG
jgi:uncharacterized membrane protein YwzB